MHTRLGKPIPSTDPVVVSPGQTSVSTGTTTTTTKSPTSPVSQTASATTGSASSVKTLSKGTTATATNTGQAQTVKKVMATPKITFVGEWTILGNSIRFCFSFFLQKIQILLM